MSIGMQQRRKIIYSISLFIQQHALTAKYFTDNGYCSCIVVFIGFFYFEKSKETLKIGLVSN